MSVHFEPVWSWMLTLLAIAAMLFVTWLGYPRRIRHLSTGWQQTLIGLRLAIVIVISLLLLRPVAVFERDDKSDAILYVMTDASGSMQTDDAPSGETRRQALLKTLAAIQPSLDEIGKKAEIVYRDFADVLRTVEAPAETTDGKFTAIGKVLEDAAAEMGRSRVPAVLFLGDGRQAASGALNVEPVQVARLFGRQQRAIFPIGFGSTEASDSSLDLALDELDLSREVFQGNVLMIRVRLKAAGAQGQQVTLRVFQENRKGLVDGQSGPMEAVPMTATEKSLVTVTPKESLEEQTVQLQITPQQFGDIKIAVEAEPLPGEVRRTNNRVETIIRVRRGGIRVAYFDSARPEQKWIREINDSTRIQLDYRRILSGALASRNRIPEEFFQPGNYDAYIIGDVPATAFTPEQLNGILRACNQGAGLMMTGGQQNFGAGGYGQTVLAPLFPVELPLQNQQLTQPQQMLPARDSQSHYVLQIASPDQNRARWAQLPPLPGANVLTPRNNSLAQVLAVSDQGFPLLIGHEAGTSRILAFAGDETWRWYTNGYIEEHTRFWRQIVLWLTRKEIDDEQPVWIVANPRDLTPGQPTELSFGIRDQQKNPIVDADFDIVVTDPKGKPHDLSARAGVGMSLADFDKTLEPGDYWARVKASRNGEALAGIAVTRFHVNARDPELDNPIADFSLLREIAVASGGEMLTPEQLQERVANWAVNGLPGLTLARQEQLSLWDNWLMLLLLIGLMSAEWALRKKRGLV